MRILIVSHSYRPHVSPRALRWSAIAEYWARQGHDVDVIAAWLPGMIREESMDGVRVWRVGGSLSERLRNRLRDTDRLDKRPNGDKTSAGSSLRAGVRRMLRFGHDLTWKNLYWPDCSCLWYFPAVRKARTVVPRNDYDVLITSSHPFTGHLIGLQIKKQFASLPWIVDVGDPFCFEQIKPTNNLLLYNRLNDIAEEKVFEAADGISVTNDVTEEIYAELFPNCASRIRVIPPLLRTDVECTSSKKLFPQDGLLRLSFIGRLHEKIRAPDCLLSTFQKLLKTEIGQRLQLHFFGPLSRCEHFFTAYESLIGKQLFLHGPVSHETARQVMEETDFLVNLGNWTNYQLPSKVVEYANSGKPILNFASISEDSSARFFATHPLALCLLFQPNHSLGDDQLARLVQFLETSHRSEPGQIEQWCQPFHIQDISRSYESLIESAFGQEHQQRPPQAA
jgi:glycosyltransferase involved in cell wall biosynthesis